MDIIPAILTNDPQELKRLISLCEGKVDRIQIDIVDGIFAKNKTIEPTVLNFIETNLKIDFHLMVKEPINWVEKCVHGQADRVFAQVELMGNLLEFIQKVTDAGLDVGLALDLDTPIEKIEKSLIPNLDAVLVMSVKAGFSGQEFVRGALGKIRQLSKIREEDGKKSFKICVDGGILPEHMEELLRSGANEVVVGKRLFQGDLEEKLKLYMGE